MHEELLIKHGAPTLAGMKTGNLFSCAFSGSDEMRRCLRTWNRAIVGKGLRSLPLGRQNGRVLIYVYRVSWLERDLRGKDARRLLTKLGYPCHDTQSCIHRLICKLREDASFPHEIGLFLGYPPEDVSGFIENGARGFKCAGCWKVYGDEETARALFLRYRRCTEAYCAQYAKGVTIDRLTVAG